MAACLELTISISQVKKLNRNVYIPYSPYCILILRVFFLILKLFVTNFYL